MQSLGIILAENSRIFTLFDELTHFDGTFCCKIVTKPIQACNILNYYKMRCNKSSLAIVIKL